MYFGEPLTDFRTRLHSDDGQSIAVEFNVANSQWLLSSDESLSNDTLRAMVEYLHDQFYVGEEGFLGDWLGLVDRAQPGKPTRIVLKTADRL